MAESRRLEFQLEQQPLFDLDPRDSRVARAWRVRCVEDEVRLTGRLPLRMVFVGEGFTRMGLVTLRLEPKEELGHAAMFQLFAQQPDVVRAYREGEITVEDEGSRYRAVALLEWDHASGRWWSAQRRVGTNAVAVGMLHGEWVEREGTGLEELGEPLQEWVDTTGVELGESGVQFTPRTDPMPDLLFTTHTLNVPLPDEPRAITDLVGGLRDQELQTQLPQGFEVFAFAGSQIEHFILKSAISFPIDDFVRAVGQRLPAEAIAIRYPGVAEIDGEGFRALFVVAERSGHSHERITALRLTAEGKVDGIRILHHERGPVGEDGMWIGKKPVHAEIELFLMGMQGPMAEG